MAVRWLRTVPWLMNRRSAICWFLWPWLTRLMISRSLPLVLGSYRFLDRSAQLRRAGPGIEPNETLVRPSAAPDDVSLRDYVAALHQAQRELPVGKSEFMARSSPTRQ